MVEQAQLQTEIDITEKALKQVKKDSRREQYSRNPWITRWR